MKDVLEDNFSLGIGGFSFADLYQPERLRDLHGEFWKFAAAVNPALADRFAKLDDDATPKLEDVKVIFRQEGPASSGNHYGCRIVQMPDNTLFLTMGDHYGPRDEAQNLGNHLGKIIRIRPDGSVPPDNPFVNTPGAKPEIWSYGHRNSQGAAINPASGIRMRISPTIAAALAGSDSLSSHRCDSARARNAICESNFFESSR